MLKKLAPFFVIVAAGLWALDGIVLRPSLYTLPVTLVVFVESTIVAILLTPFMIKYISKVKELSRADILAFIGVAIAGGAIGTMAITKALFYVNYVNLSIVILIQKLQPVFAITLAAIFLKEKLPNIFFVWGGLAITGAYFMTFGFNLPNLETGDKITLAAIFSLIAALGFGSSTVLSKRALKDTSFELGTYLRFAISSIIMLIIVISSDTLSSITLITTNQIYIFFLIAFTTGGPAIFLYYFGLKRISASVASICELAFPLTAVILEFVLRSNILGPVQWIGAVILFLSILRVTNIQINGNNRVS
jgi:drug/metabolite transporter (DMT)-like permease